MIRPAGLRPRRPGCDFSEAGAKANQTADLPAPRSTADRNRSERVWQDLHANVTRNHRCKTLVRLLDEARQYLDAYLWRRVLERPVARRAD